MADKHKSRDEAADGVAAKVQLAYTTALDSASQAAKGAATGIDANPLAALLGGLALGAAAGALLARGEKEKAMLAPLGDRLSSAAHAAIDAGRAAAHEALADQGLDTDGLREQAAKLFTQAREAAGTIGGAAFTAARDHARG